MTRLRPGWIFAAALIAAAANMTPRAAAAEPPIAVTGDIEREIDQEEMSAAERADVRALYRQFADMPIWSAQETRGALEEFLMSLDAEGIDAARLAPLPDPHIGGAAGDVRASLAALRAARRLGQGAAGAETTPGWMLPPPEMDAARIVAAAVRARSLAQLSATLRPAARGYAVLREAYQRMRALEGEPWPALTARKIELESGSPDALEVRRRLALLGDLDSSRTEDDAVKIFQARHGLAIDGRIGPETIAALNVSPAARARQIAVNLDYWRALPRARAYEETARHIAVNAAAAELHLVEDGRIAARARVIVGDKDHPTPVMAATVTGITFNPNWNVPVSIAVNEMLTKLKRDPAYLRDHNFIIIGREADPSGLTIDWKSYSAANFPFQLRQQPGPGNALGTIKFEMANPYNIYLHDTPNRALFAAQKRALSHGCVRVDGIEALAERLIDSPAQWLETYIATVMADAGPRTVMLRTPIAVIITYFTAFVDEDGGLNFRADVYGRDSAAYGRDTAAAAPKS